jgi:hypothetical protein
MHGRVVAKKVTGALPGSLLRSEIQKIIKIVDSSNWFQTNCFTKIV